MKKNLVILGSTGSIGVQALEVARLHKIKVKALTANGNIELLEKQAREFKPEYVCTADPEKYGLLKRILSDTGIKTLGGGEGLKECAALKCGMVIDAVVGMAGLEPALSALEAGNSLGLANKEALVTGGALVMETARRRNAQVIPIDSEHSAIFQSLMGNNGNKIRSIVLTASGGPFFGCGKDMLKNVTIEQALAHPNWSMGKKITVDSATMMNKGFELIEAVWLFGVKPEQVQIVVHRQSILHSAVEFEDGSIIGQMGVPDMRIPIQFAVTYPERWPSQAERLSLTKIGRLTFEEPDEDVFPCLRIAKEAIAKGGNAPCAVNCANEEAVRLFLAGAVKFYHIPELIQGAYENVFFEALPGLEALNETKKAAEGYVRSRAERIFS